MRALRALTLVLLAWSLSSGDASAQNRLVEVEFTPTARAQIAVWIESADGVFLQTLKLTESVARRGIGNRPGALQMNSGFRWPYGRREGVLPVWAHRRLNGEDAVPFRRVIFQDRSSEGFASRTSTDASPDDYYCLSFQNSASSRDELDAVTCPSQFNSDKGRYLTNADVEAGYAEPFDNGAPEMRAMNTSSLYPPRRDLPGVRGSDHVDVDAFDADARGVMPEIDAVTMATLPANARRTLQITLPPTFAEGDYVIYVEVNVEGDYAPGWSADDYPTPISPLWDFWAQTYGYPYRGQPSVVYRLPIVVAAEGGEFTTNDPDGYGDIHGFSGEITPMDGSISNDSTNAPGSGADRVRAGSDPRVVVRVIPNNVCTGDDPPPQCFETCTQGSCDPGFLCGSEGTCVGRCDEVMPPESLTNFTVELDEERSWQYAHLAFDAPASRREVSAYQVRVNTEPFEPGMRFEAWGIQAKVASLEDIALVVPTETPVGEVVTASLGHLLPQTHYYIAVRAVDDCFAGSEVAVVEIDTTEIIFTTVSPCFVATAAYGSPMGEEISSLRRFRDRHLMTNEAGRGLVAAYYELGPYFADAIRDDDDARQTVRQILAPVIDLVRAFQ